MPDMKTAIAQQLVYMHRNREIALEKITSHVFPQIITMLRETFVVVFTRDTVQSKYYALQNLNKLNMSIKTRDIGMGWDSTNNNLMLDD